MLFNGEQLHRGDILLTNNEETCCDKIGIVSNYEWCLKIYVRSFLKVQYKVTIGPFLPFIVIEIMSMVSACRFSCLYSLHTEEVYEKILTVIYWKLF